MQPKLIISPAYAARVGMSDVDLASLHDMELLRVVPASERNTCPQCGNHPADSYVQLLTYMPAPVPEKVSGRWIVWCLCETVYSFACVHAMDAEQLPGQARVRAASEATAPKPDVPRLDQWAPVYEHDMVIESHGQRRMSPMLWESLNLQQQRALAARTSHYYPWNQASDWE